MVWNKTGSLKPNTVAVYTAATMPAATGSGLVVFVSDDGPGTLYKDTAAGVWTPLNPGRIARATNATGVPTAVTNVAVDVPGCSIVVRKCSRPVVIRAGGWGQQTTIGGGLGYLTLVETTGGASNSLVNFGDSLPNSTGAGSAFTNWKGEWDLGATTQQRTFKLQTAITRDAGSVAAVSLLNGSLAAWSVTFIEAMAE